MAFWLSPECAMKVFMAVDETFTHLLLLRNQDLTVQ